MGRPTGPRQCSVACTVELTDNTRRFILLSLSLFSYLLTAIYVSFGLSQCMFMVHLLYTITHPAIHNLLALADPAPRRAGGSGTPPPLQHSLECRLQLIHQPATRSYHDSSPSQAKCGVFQAFQAQVWRPC